MDRRGDAHGRGYDPGGNRALAVGDWERAVLWNLKSDAIEAEWPIAGNGINGRGAAFSRSDRLLALDTKETHVRLIDADTLEDIDSWQAHAAPIQDLEFATSGEQFYSASTDATIGVWQFDGQLLHRLEGHGMEVLALAESPDGRRLARGGRDGDVLLWSTTTFDLVARLRGHTDYVYDLAWHPDGETLVSSSGDGTLRVWTTRTLAEGVQDD